jgi:hypothetical protein
MWRDRKWELWRELTPEQWNKERRNVKTWGCAWRLNGTTVDGESVMVAHSKFVPDEL